MARFWIGTSGWHYAHWRGRFYPPGMDSRQWLAFYAGRFPTVELNASFYREPKRSTWDLWRSVAPEGFRFAVKAHRFITHLSRLARCEESLERQVANARRLGEKLGPLLFQLPPSFHRTGENAGRLDAFLELLPEGLACAFEFRHTSWFGGDTLNQLRRRGVAFCSYDMAGVDCPLVATARHAYIRLHGSALRYHGNYTDEILVAWAERLRCLAEDVDEVWAYFNNDVEGYAVANALRLAELLGAEMPRPAAAA
jgi:uncharacterized protein YecE (DUF72 family)